MSASLSPKAKITSAQNRAVWALVSRLAKSTGGGAAEAGEIKAAAVRHVTGQDHLSQVSQADAIRLIDHLQRQVKQLEAPKREPWGERGTGPRTEATITPKMAALIPILFDQAGMTKEGARTFTAKMCKGRPWPQTQHDADVLFEALSSMVMRQNPPTKLIPRVERLIASIGRLTAWEQGAIVDYQAQLAAGDRLGPHKIAKIREMELRVEASP